MCTFYKYTHNKGVKLLPSVAGTGKNRQPLTLALGSNNCRNLGGSE